MVDPSVGRRTICRAEAPMVDPNEVLRTICRAEAQRVDRNGAQRVDRNEARRVDRNVADRISAVPKDVRTIPGAVRYANRDGHLSLWRLRIASLVNLSTRKRAALTEDATDDPRESLNPWREVCDRGDRQNASREICNHPSCNRERPKPRAASRSASTTGPRRADELRGSPRSPFSLPEPHRNVFPLPHLISLRAKFRRRARHCLPSSHPHRSSRRKSRRGRLPARSMTLAVPYSSQR